MDSKKRKSNRIILGIETSCDDTAVALYSGERGLLAHHIYHQTELHNEFGGVVPELASRDHAAKIVPLIRHMLNNAQQPLSAITGIAYTSGPGLIGALLAGATLGRSLAYALDIPAIGIHHLEGHLLAPMLEIVQPIFPFLTLLVSGGHTLLVVAHAMGDYHVLGESLDDAAGEAFDKIAKLIGLDYPGGAALAQLAQQGREGVFHFTRPMTTRPGLDFSFSGLKTQVLTAWQHSDKTEQTKADIAHAFEQAVVDTLVIKCQRALTATGLTQLVVGGGVAANQQLRQQLAALMVDCQGSIFYPRPLFCTDNAAMIAYAGYQRLQAGLQARQHTDLSITIKPRWLINALIETK